METTRSNLQIAGVALAVAALVFVAAFSSHVRDASAASITQNLFTIGGANNQQIMPAFPSWTINQPLAPPQLGAAASTSGSLLNTQQFYIKVVALNTVGTTTASGEIATTTSKNENLNITWSPVPGATGYAVFFSTTTPGTEAAYFIATTTNMYSLTSTSSPKFGSVPSFPKAFGVQTASTSPFVTVNGFPFQFLSTTTPSLGGGALGAGACATTTVSFLNTNMGSSTSVITTPQIVIGGNFTYRSTVLNPTTVQTLVCAANAGTPAAALYNIIVL